MNGAPGGIRLFASLTCRIRVCGGFDGKLVFEGAEPLARREGFEPPTLWKEKQAAFSATSDNRHSVKLTLIRGKTAHVGDEKGKRGAEICGNASPLDAGSALPASRPPIGVQSGSPESRIEAFPVEAPMLRRGSGCPRQTLQIRE
jgi:hypothetical protein